MFVHQNVLTLHFFLSNVDKSSLFIMSTKKDKTFKLERIENDLVLDFKHVVHPGRYQFYAKRFKYW